MALKNAFGELATDSVLKAVLAKMGDREVFGATSTLSRITDVYVAFDLGVPTNVVENGGTGTLTTSDAQAKLSADAGETAWLRTLNPVRYRPGYEAFGGGTFRVSNGANGEARFGLLSGDGQNGYLLFLDHGVIKTRKISNGTTVTHTELNGDPLDGSADSLFTRDGVPEAIDFNNVNVVRIRFGWYGSAPILFEVMSPDGAWVEIHTIRQPNLEADASIQNPNLHGYIEAVGDVGTVDVYSSSMGIGAMLPFRDAVEDQGNSGSSISINNGEEFVGQWTDLYSYAQVNVTLDSDQPLEMNFEYSPDQSTVFNNAVPSFNHGGNDKSRRFQFGVYARYFRVRLTNNSGSTANVNMQTTLLPDSGLVSIGRVGDVLTDDRSVTSVKAVQSAKSPDGNYYNIPVGGHDPDNFINTPLAAGESYTGEWRLSRGYESMLAFAVSDKPLTTCRIQWSQDGTNPRPSLISTSDLLTSEVELSGFYVYILPITTMIDSYFRLEVANDSAEDQTVLEADVWLYEDTFPGTYGGLEDSLSTLSTAMLVRSVAAGRQPDGDYTNTPATGNAFETSTPLSAHEVMQTDWIDTDGWESVEIFISTDKPSALDGLEIYFSPDAQAATPSHVGQPLTYTFDQRDVQIGFKTIRIPPMLDGLQLVYTNNSEGQGEFYLGITLHVAAVELSRSGIGAEPPSEATNAIITKGGIIALNDAGELKNIGRDGQGNSLNSHITQIDDSVALKPTSAFATGQIVASSANSVAIPAQSWAVSTVSITNPSSSKIYWGKSNVTQLNGDVILPSGSKDIDYDMDGMGPIYIIAGTEGGTPSNPNSIDLYATSSTGSTGVVSPDNAVGSGNGTYAQVDGDGDLLKLSGYDGGTITAAEIQSVKAFVSGRKEAGTPGEQTAYTTSTTGLADNQTIITSAETVADPKQIYILAVSRRDINADITQITDTMGFTSWNQIGSDVNNGGESRLSVYWAINPTQNGTVTVTFDTAADYAALSLMSFEDVDLNNPIADFDTDQSTNRSDPAGTVNAINNGMVFYAIGSEQISHQTPGAGYTTAGNIGSSTNNDQRLAYAYSPSASTGSKAWSATMSGLGQFTAMAVSFNTGPARNPDVQVSFDVSAVDTGDAQVVTFLDAVDEYEIDITESRSWTVSDISNLTVNILGTDIGTAAAEIRWVKIEVVEADFTVRVTYALVGENLV